MIRSRKASGRTCGIRTANGGILLIRRFDTKRTIWAKSKSINFDFISKLGNLAPATEVWAADSPAPLLSSKCFSAFSFWVKSEVARTEYVSPVPRAWQMQISWDEINKQQNGNKYIFQVLRGIPMLLPPHIRNVEHFICVPFVLFSRRYQRHRRRWRRSIRLSTWQPEPGTSNWMTILLFYRFYWPHFTVSPHSSDGAQ